MPSSTDFTYQRTPRKHDYLTAPVPLHARTDLCSFSLHKQNNYEIIVNQRIQKVHWKNECIISAKDPSKRGRPGVDTLRCSLLSRAQLGCEVSNRQRGKNCRKFIWIFCFTAQTDRWKTEIPVSMAFHCQLPRKRG